MQARDAWLSCYRCAAAMIPTHCHRAARQFTGQGANGTHRLCEEVKVHRVEGEEVVAGKPPQRRHETDS
jgi:hypothetical protein